MKSAADFGKVMGSSSSTFVAEPPQEREISLRRLRPGKRTYAFHTCNLMQNRDDAPQQ